MRQDKQYIEIAKFKTKPGVTEDQLLAADHEVRQGMLKTSEGFLLRELHQVGPDEWIVILRFTDKASMDSMLARLKENPDASFRSLGALIDRPTMRVDSAWLQA